MKMDNKDRMILSMYAKNPDVSQEEIGAAIELSQPSVAARVRKLKESGAIETLTGINPMKMGLSIAKVDVSTNNTQKILSMFRNCPYFANGFSVSGKHNLCLFFISESISTLESIVNGHIRSNESVSDVDFNIVISSEKDFIVPAILTPELTDSPPCGIKLQCKECANFNSKKCMGCPATGAYQGLFY